MMQYWYTSRRTCFYGYYFVDDFLMNFTMQMKFQECHKNLLNCIWSLDAWNTKYSKWIDGCNDSSTALISLAKYSYDATKSKKFLIGDGLDSKLCTPGYLWTGTPFGSVLGEI
jgi:hypothetical protein